MPNPFNEQVIEEFRANGGRVGGYFEGARLILLTTVGARTGTPHTTPVGYYPDGGERVLVIASAGGAPRHPDWFRNLVAHPRVTVEDGVFRYEAEAVVLERAERDRVFARAVEADPGWAEYQAKTDRVIPVVALRALPKDGPPDINAGSMAEALKVVHDAFRRELVLIRKEVTEQGTASLGAQLRVNCLTLCQGLHNHHTGEELGIFPMLAGHRPEAAPVLDRLRHEHERIAELLDELRRVVAAEDADAGRVLSEVDRLTSELEAHLTYEEEQLIPLLDPAGATR
ncbi:MULTISPECIES: nitroreductase/quinone reductase family protein [unclassified Streptomyces]|uniref:nitroreductase/quinone reductase family protein n=1 Tax=unclassified Streptomyces TaxID=2593676 RepID=UPI0022537A25|nr:MULTISPECIES: nitroreductase/quinone reductase family protein [unclassified Streptomyces]MCX4990063.1 nitroreductase/quinone reductase family protein [Streptomyces sp. NBC_00568]MCX5004707.1 nitroreductase/quinone reductase family protein [Streptomyces sp. NBC_00638]